MYIHFGLDETIQCFSEQRRRIFLLYIALCHKFATIFIQKSHTNVMYNLLYCSNGSGNECAQDTLLQGCHSFGVRLSVGVHMQYPCFSSMDQEENLSPRVLEPFSIPDVWLSNEPLQEFASIRTDHAFSFYFSYEIFRFSLFHSHISFCIQ